MAQPIPVVITDINGNLITLSGESLGLFASAPLAVMPTDVNGNPFTLTNATSGSQVGAPVPIVICDSRGYAYNLPISVTSNGSSIINISSTTGSGRRGAPIPVCLTDTNGNPITISGATLGSFVGAPKSVVLSDSRGYPVTITLSGLAIVVTSSDVEFSTNEKYDLTPCLLNLANGNILMVYSPGSNPGSSDFVICMQQSSDGGKTWTPYSGTVYGGGTNGVNAQGLFYTQQGTANIVASSATSDKVALTVSPALSHAFEAGVTVVLQGMAESTLNGACVVVQASPTPTTTTCTVAATIGNYTNASDTGTVFGCISSDFKEACNTGGVVTPTGAIIIMWEVDTGVGSSYGFTCMMSRSTDNGATWSTPTTVATNAGLPTVCPFAVVAGSGACPLYPSGALFTTIQPYTTALQYPKCYYSTDDGVTWTAAGILTAMPTNEIALAWVGGNTLVAFGRSNTGTTAPLVMAYSKDMGATWTVTNSNLGLYQTIPAGSTLNFYTEVSPCFINDNPGVNNVTLLWGERDSWTNASGAPPNNLLRFTSFDPLAAIANPTGIPIGGYLDSAYQLGAVDAGYPSACVSSGSTYLFQWMKQKTSGTGGISTAAFWQFFGTYSPSKVPVTVGAISPTSGVLGGGTSVTITGEGFTSGATVTIGGVAATSVSVVAPGVITCTTPAGSVGTANVVVTCNGQSSTLANAFTYGPALVTSGVSTASVGAVTLNTAAGATLLIAIIGCENNTATLATMSDAVGGNSNAWNYLTDTSNTAGSGYHNHTRIAYAYAATGGGALNTGASHVFTPAGGYAVCAVYAFTNTGTTSAVLNASNQTANEAGTVQQSYTLTPGSITPNAGSVVITGFGTNATTSSGSTPPTGFTGEKHQLNGSSLETVGACYMLNAAGTAINPSWTLTTNNYAGSVVASFL